MKTKLTSLFLIMLFQWILLGENSLLFVRPLHREALPEESQTIEQQAVPQLAHRTEQTTTEPTDADQLLPEAPATEAYTPNSIEELQMAHPATGIVLIDAPEASNLGTANLNFPLKLPPGRQGMQPEVSINYTSGSGNGWLGLDWDVSLPSIEIDTRWGVPRYSTEKETETYLLEGEQLSPLAHRAELQDRTADKTFHARVEGDFARIIRHGNHPDNYWWSVTYTNGTSGYYGGRPETGVMDEAVLRDDSGNIARWALTEVRDLSGNFMRYYCNVVNDNGLSNSSVPGRQLYLDHITYTGFGEQEGPFSLYFLRDRQLNETLRTDRSIDARLGFKQVTADLLRRIEVRMNERLLRSYELTYGQGAFYKTLLQSIAEYDREGKLFYDHHFEYYDEVRQNGNYQPFAAAQNWNVPDDRVKVSFVNPLPFFDGSTSLLGGSGSNSINGGSAATVGPLGSLASKDFTVGGNFSIGKSDATGLIALVDINGDALPDKVFRENEKLFYRPNLGASARAFGEKLPISGLNQFSTSKTTFNSIGFEANVTPVFVGYENTSERTTTEVYFSDFNADGLIDIASRGTVYFNHLDSNGNPFFTTDSGDTPSPIGAGAPLDNTLIEVDPAEQDLLIDQNPLHDVVRSWEAPCDGIVTIGGTVQLIEDNSPEAAAYAKNDGVRVAIQHRNNELWSSTIAGDDFAPQTPTGVGNIVVQTGDRIYFRVQSVFDGAYDQVQWDPDISYRNQDTEKRDPNDKTDFRYQASADFLLASCQTTAVPLSGEVRILGDFQKPITSDDLVVEILRLRGGQELVLRTDSFAWDSVVNQPIEIPALPILMGDEVAFRISANTNVDWTALHWMPRLYYLSATDGSQVIDAQGKPLIDICPAVDYRMYTRLWHKSPLWIAPDSGQYRLQAPAALVGQNLGAMNSGFLTLSAKGRHKLYAKQTAVVTNGVITGLPPMTFSAAAGDSLYFEYHAWGPNIGQRLQNNHDIEIAKLGETDIISLPGGLYANRNTDEMIFGPQYRGWGHFVYNGNRERALQPIMEGDLKLPEITIDTAELDNIDDPDDLGDMGDPTKATFIVMYSDPKTGSWRGYDDLTFLTADRLSSSRMGEDDISLLPAPNNSGIGSSAPNLLSKANIHAIAGGLSAGPGSLGASQAWNETCNLLDVDDFNGDGYPDIVTPTKIQYSNAAGGLGTLSVTHNLGAHIAKSEATGVTLGGAFVNSSPSNAGASAGKGSRKRSSRTKAKVNNSGKKSQAATRSAESSAGLSGGFTDDRDWAEHSWLDINGDGLPDKLFRDGRVALNFGYRFGPAENWGFNEIRAGVSTDYGAGVGINISNNSIAAGIAMSRTDNHSTAGFQDMNGDGLIDIIRYGDPDVYVRLNTGTGFGPELRWPGAERLDEGDATAESANAAFTVCIPIFFVRFCINPSGSVGHGVSRVLTQIEDVDGDGFPDHMRSDKDGKLTVKNSTIGRTNMLKTVKRPLGGSFKLDYQLVGNTYGQPDGQWVLSQVDLNDGLPGDGADIISLAYEYNDGYYDRNERQFYGFGTVKEHHLDSEHNNARYRTKVWEYDQSNYYRKGLLLAESVTDADGNKYTETRYTYALKDAVTGNDLPAIFGTSEDGSAFPAMVESRELFYEGATEPGLQSRMTYTYDRWGNILSTTDFGNGTPADQLTTDYTYHDLGELYLKDIPASVRVYGNQSLLRRSETIVDEQGDVQQVRRFLADNEVAAYDLEYDEYGNLLRLTRPANEQGQRFFCAYTYDDEVHSYLLQAQDTYGYTSSRQYDYSNGQLLENIDIRGQRTVYTTDSRGRIATVTGPYELAAGREYTLAFEYFPDATVPYAKTRHFDPEHEADIETYHFVDGLERSVQTKKTGAIARGPGQEDDIQLIVSGADSYDAFGRLTTSYYPTLEAVSQGPVLNNAVDGIAPTVTTFDILDRPLSIRLPDGAEVGFSYSIATDNDGQTALLSSRTDALGRRQDTYADVRERVQAISQDSPDGPIWTNYRYNAISELLAAIDDGGNETRYTYDRLGRRTSLRSPDGGRTAYTFDLADNLLRKVTENIRQTIPNEGAVLYTYDHERLVQIDYPKNYQNRVQLHYGAADAPHNRAGLVWLREDASGGEEYFYGPLGEVVKTIRTMLVNEANVTTYVMESEFDTWGRLRQLIYPDGEVVTYHYNRAGRLRSMDSEKWTRPYKIVDQIGYDKFENKTFIRFGNGSSTSYQYEPVRRRLEHLAVRSGNNQVLMDGQYSYDAVDNVLSLTNTAPAGTIGGPSQHQFVYDEADRLIEAHGRWKGQNTEEDYSLLVTYDKLHNIRHRSRTHHRNGSEVAATTFDWEYQYDGDQPHVPSSIGNKELQADHNGNMLGYQETDLEATYRQLLWDEEDRLMGVSNDGYISQYTYDAQSERAIKSHGGIRGVFTDGAPAGLTSHRDNYTAYVNAYLVAEKDRFTKHYYIEGERILSKIGTGKFNNQYWFSRGITAGSLNFIGRLQQLRQTIWKYYGQLGIPPGPPTMPGYYAQPEFTGNPLPADTLSGYFSPPPGWPTTPVGPPDPNGPPGPPVWFAGNDLNNDNVRAGYGFYGNGVFLEVEQFFYHTDHLGSSTYVTDYNGEARRHTEYFPFGEVFVEENRGSENQPYLFNGKELDRAAGLYYYGARYYDARLALWQSIDPLAAAYPAWSPYAYTLQNPFSFSDPDGRAPHDRFRTPVAAAKDFGRLYNPVSIKKNREYAATIYEFKRNGKYYYSYSKPAKGSLDGSDPTDSPAPAGTRTVGDIHSHGAEIAGYDNNNFSGADIRGITQDKHIGFVVTPKGYLKRYDPWTRRITTVSTDMPHDERHYGPINPTKAKKQRLALRPKIPNSPGQRKPQAQQAANRRNAPKKKGNTMKVTFRSGDR